MPIGSGHDFKGVYDRELRAILAFSDSHRGRERLNAIKCEMTDTDKLDELIGEKAPYPAQRGVWELVEGASFDFDLDAVRHGKLSPVFFGSALNNFGIESFLESFLRMTTPPLPRVAGEEEIDPFSEDFSALSSKIRQI